MASLWAQYIAELTGNQTHFIEEEWGFISYSLPAGGDSVFVEDVFVVPAQRDAAHAYQLLGRAEAAGLADGRPYSVFVVQTDSPLAQQNLRIYLALGFSPIAADSGKIWLKREIQPRGSNG